MIRLTGCRKTGLAVFGLALLLIGGCNGKPANDFDDPPTERKAIPQVFLIQEGQIVSDSFASLTSKAPMSLAIFVGVQFADNDPRITNQAVQKWEVDFGEGNGWEDVTSEARGWDDDDRDGLDLSTLTQHTYAVPGPYMLGSRLTYWDGEVVEGRPIQITAE